MIDLEEVKKLRGKDSTRNDVLRLIEKKQLKTTTVIVGDEGEAFTAPDVETGEEYLLAVARIKKEEEQ